jgi:hypothetical protein
LAMGRIRTIDSISSAKQTGEKYDNLFTAD